MRLYTTGRGHWAGTQADARKLKKEHGVPCDMHEVPVAKGELLDFLNGNTVITDRFCKPSETSVPHIAPKEIVVPEDVPTRAAATEEERDRTFTNAVGNTEDYIGKTTILVGGYFHKLHCYYYTENWEERGDEETSIEEDVLAINKLANEIKGEPHE